MNYSLNDLPPIAINMIFAGLGKLPYEDSHQLIAHLAGQMRLQDEAAQKPKTNVPENFDIAGDADELIR